MFALPIFPGERADCRQWREEGGERVAAVEKIKDQRKPADFFGHVVNVFHIQQQLPAMAIRLASNSFISITTEFLCSAAWRSK